MQTPATPFASLETSLDDLTPLEIDLTPGAVPPGDQAFQALHKAMWGNARRQSWLLFGVTAAVGVAGIIAFPAIWWIVAAVVGAGAAIAIEISAPMPLRLREMGAWQAREGKKRWLAQTGTPWPTSRTECELLATSTRAKSLPPAALSDVLRRAGRLSDAQRALVEADASGPEDLAEIECSRFELYFAVRGDGDWHRWQSTVEALPVDGVHQRLQLIEIAFYRAAYEARRDGDWRQELESCYQRTAPFDAVRRVLGLVILHNGATVLLPVALIAAVHTLATTALASPLI